MSEVIGKLLIEGDLKLLSPLIIGNGSGDNVDIEIIKDEHGQPFIPATSFVGVLRNYFYTHAELTEEELNVSKLFWGSSNEKLNEGYYQSALIVEDLYPITDISIKVRDGIKIDNEVNVAMEKHKFNYEVVEPEAVFHMKLEVNVRRINEQNYIDTYKNIIFFLINGLRNNKIKLGAMTSKGFGMCQLENVNFYEYDFKEKSHVIAWLLNQTEAAKKIDIKPSNIKEKTIRTFALSASFEIKNSLLIKSYPSDTQDPDAVHISSNNRLVLPGTSLKGAIRHRAQRIVNTLQGKQETQNKLINELFGYVDEEKKEKKKSRIVVKESLIDENSIVQFLQNRIRIDRFTGGVIDGGLFDSYSIWPKKSEKGKKMLHVYIEINHFEEWEAGLLLHILRDLWTGDLPLGSEKSIGRGVLLGIDAIIKTHDEQFYLYKNNEGKLIVEGNIDKLESFSQALLMKCQESEEFS